MTLSRPARHRLAFAFAVAWLVCPTVEPTPNGPEPTRLDWLVAVDVFAVATIVAAVVLVWRGSRLAARAGVLAAAGMAAETVLCPVTGHHVTGWWTWTQWGMTAFVLLASLAVGVLQRPPRDEWAVLPSPDLPAVVDRPSVVVIPASPAADVVAGPGSRRWGLDRPAPTGPQGVRPASGPARERKSPARVR